RVSVRRGQGWLGAGGAHGPRPGGHDARFRARTRLGDAGGEARMDGAARVPARRARRLGRAAAAPFGARLELRGGARAGPAGQGGNPPGRSLRPAALAAYDPMAHAPDDPVRAVEATRFAAEEPMTAEALSTHLQGADVRAALDALQAHYRGRGVHLVERGKRWHFETAPDLAHLLRREREQSRRLSRAATEVLAIVAYHEPVSRDEIGAERRTRAA